MTRTDAAEPVAAALAEADAPPAPADGAGEAFEFDVSPEFADYYEAVTRVASARIWIGIAINIAMGLTMLGFLAAMQFRYGVRMPTWVWAVAVAAVPLMLAGPVRRRSYLRHVYDRSPLQGSRRRVRLDEAGYAEWTPVRRTAVSWAGFSHYNETPRQFLLYMGSYHPVPLPKRSIAALGDPGLVDRVRALIGRHVIRAGAHRPGFAVEPARPKAVAS